MRCRCAAYEYVRGDYAAPGTACLLRLERPAATTGRPHAAIARATLCRRALCPTADPAGSERGRRAIARLDGSRASAVTFGAAESHRRLDLPCLAGFTTRSA